MDGCIRDELFLNNSFDILASTLNNSTCSFTINGVRYWFSRTVFVYTCETIKINQCSYSKEQTNLATVNTVHQTGEMPKVPHRVCYKFT